MSQAKRSHEFFHQSAKVLMQRFHLNLADAKSIVQTCPDCQGLSTISPSAVNPRGLYSLQLWQMDVTHVPEFGKLKYVPVSVDCFSVAIWATAQSGETSKRAQKYLRSAFAVLGIPQTIKTDNEPGYIAKSTHEFLQTWGGSHITGIPHSPTGQAIIERMNQTLKCQLQKQKGGDLKATPREKLQKAVYILNYLHLPNGETVPPIVKHVQGLESDSIDLNKEILVQINNIDISQWEGPFQLITWRRGYACIVSGTGWILAQWIKPWLKSS